MGGQGGGNVRNLIEFCLEYLLLRYTSLVRRNFLRFGKRSGGDAIEHGQREEMDK